MTNTTTTTPVGIAEIAGRAGVAPITVRKWIERHPSFPRPAWRVSGNDAWNWAEVRAWLESTDRHLEVATDDLISAGWTIDRARGTGDWAGCIFISRPADDGERIKLIVTPHPEGAYGWIITYDDPSGWKTSATRYGAGSVRAVATMMARMAPSIEAGR